MTARDMLGLSIEAVRAHRMRYGLSALAVAVGVAAVVLLGSIGEGTRRYMAEELTQFGTTLVAVNPGKVETGGVPGMMGGSVRKLTLDDARALARLPGVVEVVPVAFGTAVVERGGLSRRVYVYGCTAEAPVVWKWDVAVGSFLPVADWDRGGQAVVLGPRLQRELFGDVPVLGKVVRIGEWRFRVVGVMEPKGQFLGFDLDDAAYIPVATALKLFNLTELSEIDMMASSIEAMQPVADRAAALLRERHDGQDDVTITTQAEGQEMMDRILTVITGVVTGIAAISLLVGAIGILTVMWIVVQERSAEIGLAKAVGATRAQLRRWYLFEAMATSVAGGLAGLVVGMGGAAMMQAAVPGLTTYTPPWIVLAALGVALGVGIASGVLPAARAAALDPIEALRGE